MKRLLILLAVALALPRAVGAVCLGATSNGAGLGGDCCSAPDTQANFSVSATGNNGRKYRDSTGSDEYPPAGTFSGATAQAPTADRSKIGAAYETMNGFMRWDTSSVGSNSVTHSYLVLYYTGAATCTDSIDLVAEWYAGGSWASAGTLGDSDWTNTAPTSGDSTYAGTQACSGITTSGYKALPELTHTNNINTSGYTAIRNHMACLGGNCSTAPTGVNIAQQYAQSDGVPARLVVCYQAASATNTPTATPTTTPTPTPTATPTAHHCNVTADCADETPLMVCPPTPG